MAAETTPETEGLANAPTDLSYLFRGDDYYGGGPIGRRLGDEADAADIQDFADHVLRKESKRTSRYVSFTEDVKIARRFTSAADNRYVCKVKMAALRELVKQGITRIHGPDEMYNELQQGPRKLARQAADVRAAMRRNREFLIEGQVPAGMAQPAN